MGNPKTADDDLSTGAKVAIVVGTGAVVTALALAPAAVLLPFAVLFKFGPALSFMQGHNN